MSFLVQQISDFSLQMCILICVLINCRTVSFTFIFDPILLRAVPLTNIIENHTEENIVMDTFIVSVWSFVTTN